MTDAIGTADDDVGLEGVAGTIRAIWVAGGTSKRASGLVAANMSVLEAQEQIEGILTRWELARRR